MSYDPNYKAYYAPPRPPKLKRPRWQRYYNVNIIEKHKLGPAFYALGITNLIFYLGYVVLGFVGNLASLSFDQVGLDFSVLFILVSYLVIFEEPVLLLAYILGWVFAGLYTKKKYGKDAARIIVTASAIPLVLTFFFLLLLMIVLFPIFGSISFLLLIGIGLTIGVLALVSVSLALIGYVISIFFVKNESTETKAVVSMNYLLLPVVPPTPGEQIDYCPFRMKDKKGCSFLGYTISTSGSLICDYASTYLRCNVYSHLYYKVIEIAKNSE